MKNINTQKRIITTPWAVASKVSRYNEHEYVGRIRQQIQWIDIEMGDILSGTYCNISAYYYAPVTPYEEDE